MHSTIWNFSYLEFKLKVIQVNDLSDTNQQRGRQIRPKHHTYKDHVYLDRLFLLSNLTWRGAYVTAGLTSRNANINVNVLRRFRCIYGDCKAILLSVYIS